jgi:hypothetical protein
MAGKNSTSYKLRALRFHVVRFLLERTIEDAIAGGRPQANQKRVTLCLGARAAPEPCRHRNRRAKIDHHEYPSRHGQRFASCSIGS